MKIQKKQEIEFFGTKTGNANSIALGYATETKNFGEVAVGVMNKSTAAKDPNSQKGVCVDPDATLFSVGCGGSGERKNALEVKGDGSVIIPWENGNINIADKIKQAFDTDASIELVKSAENSLQYTLMVNNESRGSINIPKDQFLKNVTYDSEGKQLVFTFVTLDEDEHIERVPVGDLKDIYTAGEGITIDGGNVISADFSSVMTAISDEKTQRETSDNEIKSTLDTKADASAIPTKVSQLTNDSGYLTEHQSLDNCVKIGDDNTPTQLFKGQGIATVNAQQLILGSSSGSVNIQPNSINVSSPSFTFKANPTEGLGFITNTVNKGVILTPRGGVNSMGFNAKDAHVDIGGSLVGQNTAGAVYNVDGNFVNLNPLYNFKAKFENSIVLNSALNNITAATTAEEVVTKFNALLADLKNKGLMEADTTAE